MHYALWRRFLKPYSFIHYALIWCNGSFHFQVLQKHANPRTAFRHVGTVGSRRSLHSLCHGPNGTEPSSTITAAVPRGASAPDAPDHLEPCSDAYASTTRLDGGKQKVQGDGLAHRLECWPHSPPCRLCGQHSSRCTRPSPRTFYASQDRNEWHPREPPLAESSCT